MPSRLALPGGLAPAPHLVQYDMFPTGVHGHPEALVNVGHQLSVSSEPTERVSLPGAAFFIRDVVEDLRLQHEEE